MDPLTTLAPPILTAAMVVLAACALAMLTRTLSAPGCPTGSWASI